MTVRDRLSQAQIIIMRSLFRRGGSIRAVALDHDWQRKPALTLWRQGLIEIWYRQVASEHPSLRGPFYALTVIGAQLAQQFISPAPRGISGAEQKT